MVMTSTLLSVVFEWKMDARSDEICEKSGQLEMMELFVKNGFTPFYHHIIKLDNHKVWSIAKYYTFCFLSNAAIFKLDRLATIVRI